MRRTKVDGRLRDDVYDVVEAEPSTLDLGTGIRGRTWEPTGFPAD